MSTIPTQTSVDWAERADKLTPAIRNFVDGRWQAANGGAVIEKSSPRDGRLLYRFAASRPEEVDVAVASARRAFADGRWSRLPAQRRKEVLQALAGLIDQHREELALLECLDVGKPISDALNIDLPIVARIVRFNAEATDKLYGKVDHVDHSSLSWQLRRPRGVVAGIVGWNFPLALAAQKIGPVLATGNSLVLKPSELTSLSTARVAELALHAGVPEGVFNVVHGDATTGAALAQHQDVDMLTFTGSSQTGKRLLVASGQSNMKRLLLECGGKAPNIVFADAPDLDAVADGIVARAFWNQGQVCTASSRLLIQDSIKEDLLPLVIKKAMALQPGDPLKSETRFGAVVSQGHRRKIMDYVASGMTEGAKLAFQGEGAPPFANGFYVSPTIFDQVLPSQKIAQEEIFGPVLSVMSFRDEDEALRIANSTLYGLSAILWTRELGRAHRVSQRMDAGWVVVNATGRPAGGPGPGSVSKAGHKQSGLGAEGGLEGLEAYTTHTAVQFFV
jgi:acyl-CoA reductase-like NAD-dependent aldehyde dehydrogenase